MTRAIEPMVTARPLLFVVVAIVNLLSIAAVLTVLPDSPVPGFSLPTHGGRFAYSPAKQQQQQPVLMFLYDSTDAMSRATWDASSIQVRLIDALA